MPSKNNNSIFKIQFFYTTIFLHAWKATSLLRCTYSVKLISSLFSLTIAIFQPSITQKEMPLTAKNPYPRPFIMLSFAKYPIVQSFLQFIWIWIDIVHERERLWEWNNWDIKSQKRREYKSLKTYHNKSIKANLNNWLNFRNPQHESNV